MPSAALLAEPQLRQFREAGYVVVPRLVGEELLRSYREQFWSLPEIDADPTDRSTWPDAPPCASPQCSFPEPLSAPPTLTTPRTPSHLQPPMRRGGGQLPNIMSLQPGLGDVPAIRAIIEQLGGGRLEGGESMTKAIFPTSFPLPDGGATWVRPEGHVDGYTNQWNFNPGVGVTLYLDPVAERGGAFSV